MTDQLAGRTIFITGSGGVLGSTYVRRMLAQGARVIIAALAAAALWLAPGSARAGLSEDDYAQLADLVRACTTSVITGDFSGFADLSLRDEPKAPFLYSFEEKRQTADGRFSIRNVVNRASGASGCSIVLQSGPRWTDADAEMIGVAPARIGLEQGPTPVCWIYPGAARPIYVFANFTAHEGNRAQAVLSVEGTGSPCAAH